MKKPRTVISKTKMSPKWLHKCKGLFKPRVLSLFAGAAGTAVVSSFIFVGQGSHGDLIDHLLQKDKSSQSNLTTSFKELELAPAMVTPPKSSSPPTSTASNDSAKCTPAELEKALKIEKDRHRENEADSPVRAGQVNEPVQHDKVTADLKAKILAACNS